MPDSEQKDVHRTLTPEDWKRLREEKNYSAIFHAIPGNWTVTIIRKKPTWCEGWCDTLEFDPDEPIDLEYIREQWGGRRFKIQVNDEYGQYVTSFRVSIDADPRRNGRIVLHPDEIARIKAREDRELEIRALTSRPAETPPAPPAVDPTLGNMVTNLMQQLNSTTEGQISTLTKMVLDARKQQPEGRRDLEELLELAKSIRELRDMFGGEGGGGGDPWADAAGKFAEVLGKKGELDEKRDRAERARQSGSGRQKIRVVKNLSGSTAAAERAQGAATPPAAPGTAPHPGNRSAAADAPQNLSREQLAATLGGMNAEDAADVIGAAFVQMSPDDRGDLLRRFLAGGDPALLEQLEGDDGEGDDDNELEYEVETEEEQSA